MTNDEALIPLRPFRVSGLPSPDAARFSLECQPRGAMFGKWLVLDLFEGDSELALQISSPAAGEARRDFVDGQGRRPSLLFAFSSRFGTVFHHPTKQFPLEVP